MQSTVLVVLYVVLLYSDTMDLQALRTMKMQAAYRKAEAAHPRENAPKAEQIRSLGLLGKEEEASAFLTKA